MTATLRVASGAGRTSAAWYTLPAGYPLHHTIAPFTTVAIGPPRNARPWNGELRLREGDWFTS